MIAALHTLLNRFPLWLLFVIICIIFALPRFVSHSFPNVWHWTKSNSDVQNYFNNARVVLQGKTPYKDVLFEYPPLALAPEMAPALLSGTMPQNVALYTTFFMLMNALATFFCLVVMEKLAPMVGMNSVGALRLYFFSSISLLSVLLPYRFDMICALFVVTALYTSLTSRATVSAVCLCAAFLLKLYAIILLPVVAYVLLRRDGKQMMRHFLLWFCALSVLVLVAFQLCVGNALWTFVSFHAQRSLQVESLAGALLLVFSTEARTGIQYVFGADHIQTPIAFSIATVLPFVAVVALIFSNTIVVQTLRQHRLENKGRNASRLIAGSVLICSIFILCGKVFSPQYLIWILPLVGLMPHRSVRAMYLLILFVTMFYFTTLFDALIAADTLALLVVNLRNVLFLFFSVSLLRLITSAATHNAVMEFEQAREDAG